VNTKPVPPAVSAPPSISVLIADSPLCTDCIAGRVGLSRKQVDGVLKSMATTVGIKTQLTRCDGCLKQTPVHRLV
jgi:hypothetical protein